MCFWYRLYVYLASYFLSWGSDGSLRSWHSLKKRKQQMNMKLYVHFMQRLHTQHYFHFLVHACTCLCSLAYDYWCEIIGEWGSYHKSGPDQWSSVSPEFLRFPADLEVLALLGDPERQKWKIDKVIRQGRANHIIEILVRKDILGSDAKYSPFKRTRLCENMLENRTTKLTKFPLGPWCPSFPRTPCAEENKQRKKSKSGWILSKINVNHQQIGYKSFKHCVIIIMYVILTRNSFRKWGPDCNRNKI